jgi:hypothetical protein
MGVERTRDFCVLFVLTISYFFELLQYIIVPFLLLFHFWQGMAKRKSPTAFSDRIHCNSEKIQTKRKQMMVYIKNSN